MLDISSKKLDQCIKAVPITYVIAESSYFTEYYLVPLIHCGGYQRHHGQQHHSWGPLQRRRVPVGWLTLYKLAPPPTNRICTPIDRQQSSSVRRKRSPTAYGSAYRSIHKAVNTKQLLYCLCTDVITHFYTYAHV